MADNKAGLFGVKDAKIQVLLTDVEGSAPTYGTEIDVPGIKSLTLKKNITTKDNKGDEKILDTQNLFDSVSVSWENAEVSLDVISAILGAELKTTGTGETLVVSVTETTETTGQYFKLIARPKKAGSYEDAVIVIHKIMGTMEYSLTGEDFAKCSFSGKGIAIKGTLADGANAVMKTVFSNAPITVY